MVDFPLVPVIPTIFAFGFVSKNKSISLVIFTLCLIANSTASCLRRLLVVLGLTTMDIRFSHGHNL